MRIGKHKGCDGELYFGDMNGEGIRHVLNFFCGKCKKSVGIDKEKVVG